jgi:V/A-type H+-transporting ATPase subunit I
MLVLGAIVYMMKIEMFTSMLSIPFTVPETVGNVAGILAIIGGIGIILTGGRSSKNWFKRILKGLYSFYGITGYLSDILSYSRLLALGLATSVIATVFNKMGSMLGNTPVGVALFIIVFLMGHTLNLLINALGAYVHTNRLQFVEFFGKFYEGGGTKFNPFGINTKYYKFKEEKENG